MSSSEEAEGGRHERRGRSNGTLRLGGEESGTKKGGRRERGTERWAATRPGRVVISAPKRRGRGRRRTTGACILR